MRPQLRSTHSKTALVLAGGGLSGAMYEIGALRAIDDLLTDRTVNDFDIYVGTSAGSIVGALLANGITPEIMLRGLAGDLPGVRPIMREDLFHFNLQDLLHLGIKLPRTLLGAWTNYLRYINDATLADFVWSLSEALPAGLYDSHALEKYMREIIGQYAGCNDFNRLERELHIVATDLDSGQRTIFSRESNQDVPVSLAIAASTAVPLLYKPVRIADHDYVDGSVLGNASIDIAIEHGATLVICINPLVPFDNSNHASIPFFGPYTGYLSEKGLTAVASQAGRVQSHGGLLYHIKQTAQDPSRSGHRFDRAGRQRLSDVLLQRHALCHPPRHRAARLHDRHAAPGDELQVLQRFAEPAWHRHFRAAGGRGVSRHPGGRESARCAAAHS